MQALRPLFRYPILRHGMRMKSNVVLKPASMDELPVPCGPWLEHHDKKQAKYNAHLAAGVLSLVVSLLACAFSGLVEMNYSPPKELDEASKSFN